MSKTQEECPAISEKISDAYKHELKKSSFTKLTVHKVPDVETKQQNFNTAAGSLSGKHNAPSKKISLASSAAVCSFAPRRSQNLSGVTTEATRTASRLVMTNLGKARSEPVKARR